RIDEDAKSARYRTDVRLAALLRMRALLIRIAGTELLIPDEVFAPESPEGQPRTGAMGRGLAALEACEASEIGVLDTSRQLTAAEPPEPLPPFDEDLAMAQRPLPSWLGIRFHAVSDK